MDFVHQQWHFEIVDNVSGGVDQLQLALVHMMRITLHPPPACNRFLVSLSLFQELHVSDPKIAKQRLHGRCSMNGLKHILEGIKNQKPKSSVFIYVTVNTDPGGRPVVFPPALPLRNANLEKFYTANRLGTQLSLTKVWCKNLALFTICFRRKPCTKRPQSWKSLN